MSHLGERISALVDGQLAPAEAERANGHLAACRECRAAAGAERLTKQRLRSLPDVAPGQALISSLLLIGGPRGPLPPRAAHVPGTPRPKTVPVGPAKAPAVAKAAVPDAGPAGSIRPGPAAHASSGVRPATGPGRRNRRGAARRSTRAAAVVIGGLCVVGLGVVGITLVNDPVSPRVVPPVNSFVVDHPATTSTIPFGGHIATWQSGGQGGR